MQHLTHMPHNWYETQQQHHSHISSSTSWYADISEGANLDTGPSGNDSLANNYYSY